MSRITRKDAAAVIFRHLQILQTHTARQRAHSVKEAGVETARTGGLSISIANVDRAVTYRLQYPGNGEGGDHLNIRALGSNVIWGSNKWEN